MQSNVQEAFREVGAAVPSLLLPKRGTDYSAFSVIACDQFSAEPEYWEETRRLTGDRPSALRLILPEAWLPQTAEKVGAIHNAMEQYLEDGTLESIGEGLVFLRRKTSGGLRRGLMIALDLEQYEFTPGAGSLIRATEETVRERLPARIEIRRGAPLELPHVMVLLDDRENLLMDALEQAAPHFRKLYDFELMQGGGHLEGFHVSETCDLLRAASVLSTLKKKNENGFLYAVGDGNHSVAAAKEFWEEMKRNLPPEERAAHPARFVLAELISLYEEGLSFYPIHRLLMHADRKELEQDLHFDAENPPPLQEFQPKLDRWLATHPEVTLEYIHGEEECRRLGAVPGNLSLCWKSFDRETLFRDVREHGVLCRKSFSMGEARDKRYYLEARKIV